MKKFFVLAALAIAGGSAFSADVDLLIWNINLRNNDTIVNDKFDYIDQFYVKSTESGQVFNLKDYTYTSYSSDGLSGPVSDGFTENLGLSKTQGLTGRYYTDWTALSSAISTATGDPVDYGEWEFFMQLSNNGNMIGWSEHLYDPTPETTPLYLSSVTDAVYRNPNMMNPVPINPFNFGSHLVPEPTSGLLMMLGAGLLALRRRRRA